MGHARLAAVLGQVRRLGKECSDRQLLHAFAADRDPAAFTALVERHGPRVFGVCRHVLRHAQDAEDAFQATFLVLARKAGSIRKRDSLASWLHGAAYRMAMKMKQAAARRRAHEQRARTPALGAGLPTPPDAAAEVSWREVQAILDEEIGRLPEKYRAPFLLCCVDGRSRAHAAGELGIKEGTLSSRLAAARQRLQKRLARRGVALTAVLAGAALSATGVSAGLVRTTVRGACHYAAGSAAAGALSPSVVHLAQGAVKAMFLTKVKTGVGIVLACGLLTAGTGLTLRGGDPITPTQSRGHGTPVTRKPAAPPKDAADGFFRDITAESGVAFTYRNGEEAGHCAILESPGGGVAVLDYNGDGLPDLFFAGGGYFAGPDRKQIRGHPCKLYRNLGNGRFRDVTRETGLDRIDFYTHGAAVLDYDGDGRPDLLITGFGRLALYHNTGRQRFIDVTVRAGLPAGLWTTSAAGADFDGDGFADIYVCQYVDWSFADGHNPPFSYDGKTRDIAPPKSFTALPHKLFRNNRDGTFTDVSQEAGLKAAPGLGVVAADLDGDGKPDLFVANDTTDNLLFHNECQPGRFRFAEIGKQAGVARDDHGVPTGSRGIAVGDCDGSGRPSLFVTNYENELPSLFRNRPNAGSYFFQYSTHSAGIAALNRSRTGWGTAFFDYDGDGDLDLVIVNGRMLKSPGRVGRAQPPALMHNQGNGTFIDISIQAGVYFGTAHNARGLVVADLDNDGLPDLVVSHVNEPVVVLRNQSAPAGHHWIGFELVGKGRRDVVGARVEVQTDRRTQTSFAHAGGSYASSGDRRHLFGLGPAEKVKRVRVTWPGGKEQQWDGLATERYWRLTEGGGAAEARPRPAPAR
jgi:RNA polymerase sigma factor (sigma-70 family)